MGVIIANDCIIVHKLGIVKGKGLSLMQTIILLRKGCLCM